MKRNNIISILFFILGLVFFTIGMLTGDIKTGFVLIFPYIIGTGLFALLGTVFIVISLILFMFGVMGITIKSIDLQNDNENYEKESKKIVKGGGVILIGPIPIVFGYNWKIAIIMTIFAIVIIISTYLFLRFQ